MIEDDPVIAFRWLWRLTRFLLRLVGSVVGLLIIAFLLRFSTLPLGDMPTAIGVMASANQFDYITWEVNALRVKIDQTLFGLHPFMDEDERVQFVRDYMTDLADVRRLEDEIRRVYIDPAVDDPDTLTAEQRADRDQRRADLRARQPLAEAILEGQVASVLIDEGFGIGGQLFPPIAMHFSEVPNLLVVSPRDEIVVEIAINLYHMPIDEIVALEDRIEAEYDVAALVLPIGGIALFPAMVLETTSIPWALDTFAHEWSHHYLFMFPNGYTYDFQGDSRIINETTASIFGREISQRVLARYYPDLLPPPQPAAPPAAASEDVPPTPPEPPRFDFAAEMHETRVRVDELLADGRVAEAEAYMEDRRAEFVANGYAIRALNQAYFAFYGGYQSGGFGAGGSDPIGPAVQTILDESDSLYDWIVVMRNITTRERLLAARDAIIGANENPQPDLTAGS